MAVGILVIAATSMYMYLLQSRRRKQRDDPKTPSVSTGKSEEEGNTFYAQLGIAEEHLPTHIQREIHKERKRRAKVELISMKSPMYDNVYMLDSNKELMCTISMKKARWYTKKGIAKWSSFKEGDHPTASDAAEGGEVKCIRLLFQHNGASADSKKFSPESLYLRSPKENVCVQCGADGHHIRHYIVPYAYRALLPEEYKAHMSHDIVILCPDCHLACERPTKRRMKETEREARARAGGRARDAAPTIENPRLHRVRGCAIALAKWKDHMPAEKVESYERDVRAHLAGRCEGEEEKAALLRGEEALTKKQLQQACSVNYRVRNPQYVPGAEVVVSSLKDAKSIEDFIIDWRKYFISTFNPRRMPTGWRVDNPVACGIRGAGSIGECEVKVKSW